MKRLIDSIQQYVASRRQQKQVKTLYLIEFFLFYICGIIAAGSSTLDENRISNIFGCIELILGIHVIYQLFTKKNIFK
jgi:hypothetical protein